MTARKSNALPLAWLLAATGVSCAHSQTPAEQTHAAAERSQSAYQKAEESQRNLEEQQKRVDAAHQNVVKLQDQLAQARTKEEQERARAQQLQQQASQNLQQATQQAQLARSTAMQAEPKGMQTFAGRVTQSSPDRLVVQSQAGRTMSFNLDQRTRVLVGREERSATDIQQGADAQVAYDASAAPPTALTIQVTPAGA